MKSCYVDVEHRAIADVCLVGTEWLITRINVPQKHRGKGLGTRLLQQILDDADAEGAHLALMISPSDGLDYKQLHDWYARHGFKQRQPGLMDRYPQKVTV